MRTVFIYNPYNPTETALLERAKKEISNLATLEVLDLMEAREHYPVRTTPALIVIRDDFQGEHLLDTDELDGQLRVTGLLLAQQEEEAKVVHNMEPNWVDHLLHQEVRSATEPLGKQLVDATLEMAVAKTESDTLGKQLIDAVLKQAELEVRS
ncbi:hypothetical protein ACM1RC_32775 [Paenibacillus azoreducens]|uniref:hypothetical protein n=1 Tax=Paenibacillus azoreducens TaxID=116718 RepID=UPI0039F4797B